MQEASLITKRRVGRRTFFLLGLLLGLALIWLVFHRQISHGWEQHLLLNSNAPREEFFEELAAQSENPTDFLNQCWATGKVTHRQLVTGFLRESAPRNPRWFARAEPLLVHAAYDGDASVREVALATLDARNSPLLFQLAEGQLHDVDPDVRWLGLNYLRKAEPRRTVPVLIRLLDDPDPRVVAESEVMLMRWSGEDYGVRTHMAVSGGSDTNAVQRTQADTETIRRGVERRKQWWQAHSSEYSSAPLPPREQESARAAAPDFVLKDLNGKSVHLADFRGKVVLVNFWATWCTACLAEITDLIALQKRVGDRVAIVGVALDGVPTEHGESHSDISSHTENQTPTIESITGKVARAVNARGINYTVLLDPRSSVGGQFNGGELPTTVIFDAQGRVRRRFVGERTTEVFEAMLAEAVKPVSTPAK